MYLLSNKIFGWLLEIYAVITLLFSTAEISHLTY